MMLSEQKNYDAFHPDGDRIYRVLSGRSFAFNQNATVPMPLAAALKDYNDDLEIVQITRSVGGDIVYNNKSIQLAGYFADPSFFDVFGFEFKQGNSSKALSESNGVVLTEQAANLIFGQENPLGKVVTISDRGLLPSGYDSKLQKPLLLGDFTVTGIVQQPPNKSHLEFDLLLSSEAMYSLQKQGIKTFPMDSWDNYFTSYTYFKTPENFNLEPVNDYLNRLSETNYTKGEVFKLHFELQALKDITPGKLLNYAPSLRMPRTLYIIFAVLILFLVLIASFNYTNITIARSMIRAKVIGIRKVSGASRINLIVQFMTESVTFAMISAVLAVLLLFALKPAFMSLHINKYLNYELGENIHYIIYAILLVISVGLFTGIVPSFILSRMRTTSILKSTILIKSAPLPALRKVSLHKTLVFTQFFFSIIFIVSTILMVRQSNHYFRMETGFVKENIVIMDMQGHSYDDLISRFGALSEISNIEASDMVVGAGFQQKSYSVTLEEDDASSRNFPGLIVSKQFLNMYEIDLLAGTNFDEQSDENHVLINMFGAKVLGFDKPEEIVGKTISLDQGKEFAKIIGVTSNFQSCMPLAQSEQLIIRHIPEDFQYLSMKLADDATLGTFEKLRATWKEFDPVHEAKFDLLANEIESSVSIFKDISSIIGFITIVSIFISCFGLLGITVFITERRIKEIGIRKVFGANPFQLHGLLSRSFIRLILLSSLVAAPFAFLFNGMWLNRLANKVSFGFETLLGGIIIVLLLGIITISVQVVRLSMANPARILQEE
jgi:putative ABC transport system permease protein